MRLYATIDLFKRNLFFHLMHTWTMQDFSRKVNEVVSELRNLRVCIVVLTETKKLLEMKDNISSTGGKKIQIKEDTIEKVPIKLNVSTLESESTRVLCTNKLDQKIRHENLLISNTNQEYNYIHEYMSIFSCKGSTG